MSNLIAAPGARSRGLRIVAQEPPASGWLISLSRPASQTPPPPLKPARSASKVVSVRVAAVSVASVGALA